MTITLIPAYGRDYTSPVDIRADWFADRDFGLGYPRALINRTQFRLAYPGQTANVRYASVAKIHAIPDVAGPLEIPGVLSVRLTHAVTRYDMREASKRGYNPYALAQYLEACDTLERLLSEGVALERALESCFSDRLLQAVRRAVYGMR